MTWRLCADAVVLLHFAFIVYASVGGLLVLRWRRSAWLHLPCVAWGALIEFAGWTCPLTPLENRLRRLGGEAGYDTGFIEHYLLPVIYPSGLTRGTAILLGAALLVVNLAVYAVVLRRLAARRGPPILGARRPGRPRCPQGRPPG